MIVRVHYGRPHEGFETPQRRPFMRRTLIYPHRSVRAIRLTPGRILLTALTILALTAGVIVPRDALLSLHNRLCVTILHWSGIPVVGVFPVKLFAQMGLASVPVVPVQSLEARPLEYWLMFMTTMLVLIALHRRIPFARSLLVLLMTLLMVAVGVAIFHPSSQFGSAEFASMWLRSESLVWFVLPWFSASMFVFTQPAAVFGVGCAVLAQIYGFVWSAIRLAFCIAVMHFSGILFAPMLWFLLGLLADVIYLVVFYSLAVKFAAKRSWGKRA